MSDSLPEEIYATFAGFVDNQASQRFFNSFSTAVNSGVKHVHLLLQSGGGIVGDGVAIHNYLKNLPLRITSYNGGCISSIAVIIFLAAKGRKASVNGTFMIHKTTHNLSVPVNAEMMRIRVDSAELDDRNTEAILRSYLTMPTDKWNLHARGDLIFGADVAKEFGLIHEIEDFKAPEGSKIYNI